MKKLLQINPVLRVNTSTGRIMQEIGELAMQYGWESYIAYSKGRDGVKPCKSVLLPIGDKLDVICHGMITRLFDRHGLASCHATEDFVREIEKIAPDIVHIHNIHGYFLNYPILFDYLSRSGIPVVWTVHDCWLYTGHCYYYSYIRCNKWQTGCGRCPQKHKFPTSLLFDRSVHNYQDKKAAFTSVPKNKLTVVPVSYWIKDEMRQSFFYGYDFRVIHNGIDTSVFDICHTDAVREKYGLHTTYIILGVASIWSEEKGLNDFIRLAGMLNDNETIVLVGVGKDIRNRFPKNIIGIGRTENIRQLAELYSISTAFVNLTWQDNYPTVNLESIACGTLVVSYRTGGSVEAVTEHTGFIVEQGDLKGVIRAVRTIESRGKDAYQDLCRKYALAHFRKEDCYMNYLKLYDELIKR